MFERAHNTTQLRNSGILWLGEYDLTHAMLHRVFPFSIAAERALATLTSIYTFNTVQSHTQLQAKACICNMLGSVTTALYMHFQCVYGIGRALLLLSEHTSPDPPCQWWERHGSGTMSNPEDNKGDDAAAMHLNRHSALSMVMRKEEASKAEVSRITRIYLHIHVPIHCFLSDSRE